jgi:hypothetical protein
MAKKQQFKAPIQISELDEVTASVLIEGDQASTDGAKAKMEELIKYIGAISNISVYRKNQLKRRINGLKRDVC